MAGPITYKQSKIVWNCIVLKGQFVYPIVKTNCVCPFSFFLRHNKLTFSSDYNFLPKTTQCTSKKISAVHLTWQPRLIQMPAVFPPAAASHLSQKRQVTLTSWLSSSSIHCHFSSSSSSSPSESSGISSASPSQSVKNETLLELHVGDTKHTQLGHSGSVEVS